MRNAEWVNKVAAADAQGSAWLAGLPERVHFLRPFAILLAHSGDSPLWIVGLLLTLWLGSDRWRYEAGVDLIGVIVTAGIIVLIKFAVRRPRPAGEWGQGYRRIDPHSFPSGHAARAAMLAVVALALGPAWWAAALFVWAPLVGLARVIMGVHYLSDIVVGAGCGIGCGVGVVVLMR
jgi:undecaprenyl-diphosphatase